MVIPVARIFLGLTLVTSFPTMGMVNRAAIPPGPMTSPAWKEVYPMSTWRKMGSSTMLPKRLKNTKNMTMQPLVKLLSLKRLRFTMGCS